MPVYPLPDGGVLLDPLMAASNFLVGWFAVGLYLVAIAGFLNFAVQVWRLYPTRNEPDPADREWDPAKVPQALVTNGAKVLILLVLGTLAFIFPDDMRRWPWLLLYLAYVATVLYSEVVQLRSRVELPRVRVVARTPDPAMPEHT